MAIHIHAAKRTRHWNKKEKKKKNKKMEKKKREGKGNKKEVKKKLKRKERLHIFGTFSYLLISFANSAFSHSNDHS